MSIFHTEIMKKTWLTLRPQLGKSTRTIKIIGAFSKRFNSRLAKEGSKICVEAYPRSANTYMMALLTITQPKLRHTSHTHLAGNVLLAIKNHIPAVVLIRNPVDCILSHAIYEPLLSVEQHIRHYILFYKTLLPQKNHFLSITFENLTNQPKEVINRINKKFDLDFVYKDSPSEQSDLINKWATANQTQKLNEDTVARPSESRAKKKQILQQELANDTQLMRLIDQANDLYSIYKNQAIVDASNGH